jgi:hypothetical protein
MLTLNDGRIELWQWDTGRMLSVDADCSQVHFSNKVFGRSIDVDVVDGVAIIPDILLQTDKDLTAWAFVGTAENGYTKISKVFKVNKRNKPADYVFTPTDQTTLGEILDRIEDLENRPSGDVSDEDIQNAVNDYLEKNLVSIEEKDPTVPDWAKQPNKPTYTAKEVGALPADTPIPEGVTDEQIKNAVDAYLTENPVEVGGGEWETIADITTTEEVSSIAITSDLDGNAFQLSEAIISVSISGTASNTSEAALTIYTNQHGSGGGSNSKATRMFRGSGKQVCGYHLMSNGGITLGTIHNIGNSAEAMSGYFKSWDSESLRAFYFDGGIFGVGSNITIKGVRL